MNNIETKVSTSPEQLARDVCQWLISQIKAKQVEPEGVFVLALSGGSTPKRLYQLLAEKDVVDQVDWTRIILIWGDERNVPADHADSNFQMVRENLLEHVSIPQDNVLGVADAGGDAASAAAGYEKLLRERLFAPNEGSDQRFPSVDCVLLGLGDDVHTASLFPGTKALEEKERWVVENWVEKLDCWRITLSAPFINSAKEVVFLIAGANKTDALRALWKGKYDPETYPAQLVRPAGKLIFMLDEAAIGDLDAPNELRQL